MDIFWLGYYPRSDICSEKKPYSYVVMLEEYFETLALFPSAQKNLSLWLQFIIWIYSEQQYLKIIRILMFSYGVH